MPSDPSKNSTVWIVYSVDFPGEHSYYGHHRHLYLWNYNFGVFPHRHYDFHVNDHRQTMCSLSLVYESYTNNAHINNDNDLSRRQPLCHDVQQGP